MKHKTVIIKASSAGNAKLLLVLLALEEPYLGGRNVSKYVKSLGISN